MRNIALVTILATGVALAGCTNQGPKQTVGSVGGAVLGGLLGAQVGGGSGRLWATGAGAVLGALVGSEIGRSLDDNDRRNMEATTQASLEHTQTNTTSSWTNPDSGNSGTVTPTRTYQSDSGRYCREYQQTITVGGKTEDAYGTACRQEDGSWKIVS